MSLFKDLKQSLEDAIEYEKGSTEVAARVRTRQVTIVEPPRVFKAKEIRNFRLTLNMDQKKFSEIMAVSHETIAKWEQGKNTPTPVACRLMEFISNDPSLIMNIFVRTRKTEKKETLKAETPADKKADKKINGTFARTRRAAKKETLKTETPANKKTAGKKLPVIDGAIIGAKKQKQKDIRAS